MGGHEDWGQPSGITPNGLLPSPESGVTQVLDAERWAIVEARTAELIARIQPNKPSEDRRNAVANYVQQLITKCFSCQVFTFGSVPLKTYLPDGDIDLTAFSKNVDLKDTWANEVKEALENEERSENAEFRVKEVQYIQAEVKIIKCLVENIVVDISFNQLGGLCTLCFLEEIDHLINQDHLFKRSIILIKAWCYYESRILGAHHGLISTYALETLVLYIFHVFNNSFKGPLEVLYRFLEFFSKFDWENFCVSLWGPVPIHSLPDMTAEPPRKDSGELLLSQIFLNACSSVYAVFPHGHENQGQPFVSKHFNVIDPLRTNNNLGRSVSKGNFYRIRSAFAFGAKRLAGLLECSKEHMISEIDKFFTNTWKRYGSGIRPDAPDIVLSSLQPSSVDPFRGPDSLNNHATNKNIIKNVGLRTTEECLGNGPVAINGITQPANIINQTTRNISRTSSSSSQNEKNNARQASSKIPDHIGRSVSSSQAMQTEKCQANPSANYSSNDYSGQGRFQFARTHSSPELSDSSADILSHGRRNIAVEIVKNHLTSERPDRSGRKKNFGIDIPGAMRSNIDPSSPIYSSCHQISSTAADSNCDSNSYHDDTGFSASREELTSVSHTLEMHQEEQDLINMMAAPRVNFNGMVPVPINIASHHLPVPPPMLPSMGFSQKNVGVFPPNMPIVEPPWGSNLQFHQGPVTSPLTNYFPNARIESNPEGMMESGNESSGMSDINQEDGDHGIWPDEDAVSSVGFVPDDRNFQMLNSNDKKVHHLGGFGFIPIPQAPNSNTTFVRDQPKFGRENKSLERERQTDASVFQNTRETDSYSCNRSADLRLTHASHSTSRNISSESWDSQTMKSSKSERDKRGSKLVPSAVSTPIYGKTKSWGHYEDSSLDHNSVPTDNDIEDWIQKSASGSEMAEQNSDVSSLASASHQSTGHDPALMSGPDSVFPRMIVCAAPGQGPGNSNGMGPFTHFYPTGPPVPFYMFPCYKVPSESGNPEGLLEQFNGLDMNHLKSSMSNLDLEGRSEHPENPIASNSMQGVSSELPEEHKSDILNGDFSSHWQNLQYGRLCQGTNVQGPPVYPVPIQMVPPMYLQGHFPWDGPGRPFPANANVFAPVVRHGQRLLQVMPVHPGSIRHTDVYQRHGDEMPRYRSGTGTYLPKTKVPYRDKQASSTRNRRGGYNPERNEQGDREGSWISSKSRVSGRSHGRGQYDRPSTRPDRLPNTDNRTDRSWDSHKHERISSSHQNSYLSPTNSNQGSASVSYSMYPLSSASSNTVNPTSAAVPSVMMLYSYDPSLGYGSSSEQVEFGSLGPMHLSGLNEVPQPNNGGAARNVFEHRRDAYQQGSSCSSPEQPSSPQIQRRR